jgi:hypothetical protein
MIDGFRCPPGSPTHGEDHPIAHCMGRCEHPCVAPPLLAAIVKADRANHHAGAYISATMLTGKSSCARQVVLERTRDYRVEPRQKWWAFRGGIVHALIEGAEDAAIPYGWLQELRLKTTLTCDDGVTVDIGATVDCYNPVSRKLLDFKSMADVKVMSFIKGTPVNRWATPGIYSPHLDDAHVLQTNIYRWVLSRCKIPDDIRADLRELGIEIDSETWPVPDKLYIQAISMQELPLSGGTYWPQRAKEGYTIDEVPVIPLDELEDMIRPRARQWYSYLVEGVHPPVVDEDDAWLCRSCGHNGELYTGAPCRPVQERLEQALDND